jgi:Flp pilus assembly protein TadG
MHGLSSKLREKGAVGLRRARERGVAVLVMAILMVIALPVVGLMFDSTMLFIIKARLQGAVDGAALAGARALARGADSNAQTAQAQSTATSYVNLNYPSTYFFSGAPTIPAPTVDLSVAFQRTINVTANVTFPGIFLPHMISSGPTTVSASAQVTRKDVNVVMVLDRSGSMSAATGSNSCNPMIAAAQNFVAQFAPARDNVGVITFASSTYVNFPLANTFQSANPNATTLIGNIVCAGSTSSAAALSVAYQQLANLNQPGALNVILFFTDGQPTGVTFNMPILTTSTCTAYTPGNPGGPGAYVLPANAHGYIRGTYNTFTNSNQFFGILKDDGAPGSPAVQVISNSDLLPATNSAGCTYYNGWAANGGVNNMTNTSDMAGVPLLDVYGNSTNTSYQPVTLANGMVDVNNPGQNAPAMPLNAADSAATNIRNGVVDPVSGHSIANVLIFSIGLGNATIPASPTFLERVSNDSRSPIYDSTKPTGTYYPAPTVADLAPAFQAVASEILRLAR